MLKYFIKRFLSIIPKLLIITLLIFLGMELLPVDPISRMLPKDVLANMTAEQIEAIRESLGLNAPVLVRYFRWIGNMLKGDFGYSHITGASITVLLQQRLPATLELNFYAFILATTIGIVTGCFAAKKKNTLLDVGSSALALMINSIPTVFFAMLCSLIFAVKLRWLPAGGRTSVDVHTFWDRIPYMIMPVFCSALPMVSNLLRMTRLSMLDVMGKDYIKTARAKGQTEGKIFSKHIFRNGSMPVMMILVGRFTGLLDGTVFIETIFDYPGMGSLVTNAMGTSDVPVAMTVILISVVMNLLASFLCDVVIAAMDPRVRFGKEG